MVAQIFQMPDADSDLGRYARSRRHGAPRAPRQSTQPPTDHGLIERLIAGGLIEPRPIPVSNSDRGPPARHWKENLPAAIAVLRQHGKTEPREDEAKRQREARHRNLERMYGRSLSPFPPGW